MYRRIAHVLKRFATRSPQPPTGRSRSSLTYAPKPDGHADPGEIVWMWVPFEEDAKKGKDRPVLIVGRDGQTLLALMLSSQSQHDYDSNWLPLGAGDWDHEHRPSWIRLDRVLRVHEQAVRREGAVLARAPFDKVAAALRANYGWS